MRGILAGIRLTMNGLLNACLLNRAVGENDYFLGRSLDVFITKIRKYLKDDPELNIENVFGVGFIFNVPEEN